MTDVGPPARKQVILDSRIDGDLAAGRLAARPALAAGRPGQCVGGRLLRRPRRRGADRDVDDRHRIPRRLCRAWEAAPAPAADAGIRTVAGPHRHRPRRRGGALGRQLPLFRLGLGGRLGSGTQFRSWISLEDEVGAIVRCLEDNGVTGPGQRHRPGAGHRRRVRPRLSGAPSTGRPPLPVPATALRLAPRRRDGRRDAAGRPAGAPGRAVDAGVSSSPIPIVDEAVVPCGSSADWR